MSDRSKLWTKYVNKNSVLLEWLGYYNVNEYTSQSKYISIGWQLQCIAYWPVRRRRTRALQSTAAESRQLRRADHGDDAGPWDVEMRPCWQMPGGGRHCYKRTGRQLSTACTTRPRTWTNLCDNDRLPLQRLLNCSWDFQAYRLFYSID